MYFSRWTRCRLPFFAGTSNSRIIHVQIHENPSKPHFRKLPRFMNDNFIFSSVLNVNEFICDSSSIPIFWNKHVDECATIFANIVLLPLPKYFRIFAITELNSHLLFWVKNGFDELYLNDAEVPFISCDMGSLSLFPT